MKLDEEAIRAVLGKMPDGFIFESFAKKILAVILGDEFIPVGGSGDQGVDGYEYLYHRSKFNKLIFQMSTEQVHWKQEVSKITSTMDKLISNKVEVDSLFFITNRKIDQKNAIQDKFYEKYNKSLVIYDREYFVTNIGAYPIAADIYKSFVDTSVHEYNRPSKIIEVGNFSSDPRLYVFLRQHVDASGNEEIEANIIDGLILYVLEETGSEKGVFKDSNQIVADVKALFHFELPDFLNRVEARLLILSKRQGQKIKHHTKEDNYCMPFETRVELKERDIKDIELQDKFIEETTDCIQRNLDSIGVIVSDAYTVFEDIIHSIYYRQGLEFSDFIINETAKETVDESLKSIVSNVVDNSHIIIQNRAKAKTALLISTREVAYNGTDVQREFLRRLSKTYMLVFLTQNDPKISMFFKTLANKLDVFVGTSIIIPALSEYHLEEENKRYWNLLKGANFTGVSLKVNEYIIDELVSHFEAVNNTYLALYSDNEEDYLNDEITLLYIDEILIRSYFYSKRRGKVANFESFIMKFVNPNLSNIREDIIFFLKEEFGIEYITTASQNVQLDHEEVSLLSEHLKIKKKGSLKKAEVDAKLILHIYKLREMNNETNKAGIFGYQTWWLSLDVNTFKSVQQVFKSKFPVSCYMRADFMYKYISFSPRKKDIDMLYKKCFPSLLGVNLSYHIPPGISSFVSQKITEFKDSNPMVVKRTLKSLTEKLMSSVEEIDSKKFKDFFETELEKIIKYS